MAMGCPRAECNITYPQDKQSSLFGKTSGVSEVNISAFNQNTKFQEDMHINRYLLIKFGCHHRKYCSRQRSLLNWIGQDIVNWKT